jgi:hypothetical protein
MITAPDQKTEVPPQSAGTASGPVPTSHSRLRLAAGITIVALSAVGMLMLGFGEPTQGSILDVAVDESSSLDFLQPVGGDAAGGPARLKYQSGDDAGSISNGGIVPVGDGLQMAVTVSPYPPTSFDVVVDLQLTTPDGSPVDDAAIRATWDMIFMYHGPFETEFEAVGDGHYTAPFDFFMFGPWELLTEVDAPSHQPPGELAISIYVWPE